MASLDKLQQAIQWMARFEKSLIIFAGSFTLTALLLSLDFNFLEANLYDLRVAQGFQSEASSEIAVITLDDATTKEFNEFSPLSLKAHTSLIESLSSFHPKAVGYLVDLNHVSQVNPEETKDQSSSTHFVEAVRKLQHSGTEFILGTPFDVTGEVLPPAPLNVLPHAVAVIHKDGNVFSEDKITRRALLSLYGRPSFHLSLARKLGYLSLAELPKGDFYVPEVDGEYFFFRYHGSTVLNKQRPKDLPYKRYSFADVVNRRVSMESLKNKVLLVGTLMNDDSSDFAFTPYSKMSFSNPKLLLHANILDSLFNKDGIIRVPKLVNWGVTLLVTTIVLWWIMTSTPLYGVFATLSLALLFMVSSQLLFQFKGIWIRESQPVVGIFVSYYLAVPYRLIREYKKRWDYQRKNELLTQVEELKTNFLSLVTHDLKTPIARIQGLTEVFLRNASQRLTASDQNTLKGIFSATNELNHFITSILELSKIDSNRLNLQLESKDINHLIEKTIDRFTPIAQQNQIRIFSKLEPIFPIKIDSSLISKVINNLLDNAIKYSPTGSEVQIESEERDNWVIISIKDQGIGMSPDEKEKLFTRFFRAKNDTTTKVSGTGLGLYLTKYFIEAHHGKVEVTSERNQGSTFRIFLPIQEIQAFAIPSTFKPLEESFDV